MSEKAKMLRGEPYNSRDPELIERYHRARALMGEYNGLDSRETEKRAALLHDLLGGVGVGVWVEAPFYCDYGENIFIGDYTFVNMNCLFQDNHTIHIGSDGLIGPGVHIYTAQHPLTAEARIRRGEYGSTYLTYSLPVRIGDCVWIGGQTVILPGVTIGNNVTIGAGSVVTKDLPDNVLAVGNPCRVVRAL